MSELGNYKEVVRERGWSTEMLDHAAVKNRVYGLVEFDVTKARQFIHDHKDKTGETLSFTGWIIKCIGKAVAEDKEVNAYGKGRSRFVVFDDVDVSIVIEREVNGEKLPWPYVVRRANTKSFMEIHEEIRAAQKQEVTKPGIFGSENRSLFVKVFQVLPSLLRRIGWWRFRRDPFLKKKVMGTVGLTSVGMFGTMTGWPIAIGYHSLEFALGGITRKQILFEGKPETHEYLSATLMFDHDVIDGGPATRFTTRLAKLIEDGYGLNDQ